MESRLDDLALTQLAKILNLPHFLKKRHENFYYIIFIQNVLFKLLDSPKTP